MLYIMNIAKLVFPLITLPYLTRVLSVDCYGVVSYVKATMVYAQLVVDFGFMLSAVSYTHLAEAVRRQDDLQSSRFPKGRRRHHGRFYGRGVHWQRRGVSALHGRSLHPYAGLLWI